MRRPSVCMVMTDINPVEVIVHVPAAPAEVFPYFTDPVRYVQWMGSQAELEPVPGGMFRVDMPDGFAGAGTFTEVASPHLVVFTWGFADDEAASHTKHAPGEVPPADGTMPAGSTRITVTLADQDGGTQVTLRHEDLPSEELRAAHDVAWNTYLPRLAVVAAGGDPGPDPHA
jgi:uncharacterized protein YndB with AHSA1/START domain